MNRLRELRKEKRLTLIELAELIHINKSSIARFETEQSIMDAKDLEAFCKFFGCSTDYLLGKSNERNEIKNSSTSTLDNIDLAFYNQHGIVSEAQKKEIESFIEFIKSKNEAK